MLLLYVCRTPVLVDPVFVLSGGVDVFAVLVVEQVGLHSPDIVR